MAGDGGQGRPEGQRERLPLVLAVLGFGLTTWLAFLIRASRQQEPRWFAFGLLYLGALVAAFLIDPGVSNSPAEREAGAITFLLWLFCWIGGAIHLFKTRPAAIETASHYVVSGPSEARASSDLKKLDSRRVGARLIDEVLIFAASFALSSAFETLTVGLALFFLWGSVVYFFVCELTTGQTLGKKAMGLRVMKRDGTPPGAASIAGRNVVRIVEEPVLALIAIVATRKRRQRIGDLIAGTTVGRAEGSHRPAPTFWRIAYPAIWAACAAGYVLVLGLPVNKSVAEVMAEGSRSAYVSGVEELCEAHNKEIHSSGPLSASELLEYENALIDDLETLDRPPSVERGHQWVISMNNLVRNQVFNLTNPYVATYRRVARGARYRVKRAYAIRAFELSRAGIQCYVTVPPIGQLGPGATGAQDGPGVHMVGR